ncbi:divalent-cation tolerance protein CutA [Candidimonas nitroreducens]|uniref:Divalent-cation tolerance protein CutA n=1 Tax=Candidimonas nitroreducens TaxID=683354 RepID=A0A225MVD9_9BURK|nr:divalent-cation tolerance protein CutA [Candidimonas nitroreducens]OWT63541.1 divalent-cation tolerance protein CutA [Candidimonas nitroreducens]
MSDPIDSSAGQGRDQAPAELRLAGHEPGDEAVLVLSNAPDALLAKRIAHVLIEERLAACVHLGAAGLSMYMWHDTLEGAEEIPLLVKTTRGRLQALADRLRQLHPYEVPEILVVPVLGGLASYMDWMREQVAAPPRHKE